MNYRKLKTVLAASLVFACVLGNTCMAAGTSDFSESGDILCTEEESDPQEFIPGGPVGIKSDGYDSLWDFLNQPNPSQTTTSDSSSDDESEEEDEESGGTRELSAPVLTEKIGAKKLGSAGTWLNIGESGTFDIDRADPDYFKESDLAKLTRLNWSSSDSSVLTVDNSTGSYHSVKAGAVTVTVTGYTDYKMTSSTGFITTDFDELFSYSIKVSVLPNMSGAVFDATEGDVTVNAAGTVYGMDDAGYARFTLSGVDYVFDSKRDAGAISVSDDSGLVSYSMEDNVLSLSSIQAGDTMVSVRIGQAEFNFTLHVTKLKQKGDTSPLLVKGKSTKLSLYQVTEAGGEAEEIDPSEIEWSASNSRVSVSDSGKVKAKKLGATCIKGKYKDFTYYWVVNVCTAKKAKAIAAGHQIAKGTYSQPRRMMEAYYDCSSLVWRAYKPVGINFGTNVTAPVAASEGKYLYDKGKMIDGAIGKSNTQKLKLRPGDLLFEGGASNGRWGGIYHVEMFEGYAISSIDSDGKPIYMNTWVNRSDGCYGYGTANDYVGRP